MSELKLDKKLLGEVKRDRIITHIKDILPTLKEQFLFWGLMYVAQFNYETSAFKLSNMLGTAIALKSINNTDFFTATAAKSYIVGQLALFETKAVFKSVLP